MSQSTTPRVRSKAAASSTRAKPRKAAGQHAANTNEAPQWALLQALTAFRDGDFTARLPTNWGGLEGRIAETFNQAITQEQHISEEVARLSVSVGKDGRLTQRMSLPGARGSWSVKVESLNTLLDDLVRPTTEVARTIGAVAKGDLGQSMDLEVDGRALKGEFLRSAKLVNTMIEQLSVFTSEVTRVAREVGTEGKLGGQAKVKGVSGVWKDLTESVNQMAGNLTAQVRNIADVTIAVANGDLSKKITVDVRGEILQLKEAINTMVDQLRSFASEVTRVAREVGTDGRLGGQAVVPGVAGTWKDLTDSVNAMATNLTAQVRNIATVTTAVARGDLSRKITVDVKGEILAHKISINTMVDQLNGFASEVTRVAREVGTEGELGGQAEVRGVAGTWKDLTDSVNAMATNLTAQVRNIAEVTTAVANGDLSKKITVDVRGEILELKNTINTMVDQLNGFAGEVSRVAREVGTDGKLGGQATVEGVAGTWKDLTDNVNSMASNLTGQVRNIADVATAVANGDLSKKITVEVKGEILALKNTVNTMVDQLNGFASEVTRVAREVGTEGKLGGQAMVPGVAGTWKDLTDNVNFMASNLTGQVRNIADVATAIAKGDLSKKITVDVRGEILALKETINTMVDQLRAFSVEVSRVAREVGTDGKLGGQAAVDGVAGTWKDLTDNVNSMASNLTGQVRNIAEVTIAVANGDLSKKITVDVRGEILQLKETINTMVEQLRSFASEVTRVAREVGTEGRLGGQAAVPGVAGTWKDLTDTVNGLANNLTTQVRNIAEVTTAVARGDLNRKITVDVKGEILELKETINTMVDQLNGFSSEVTRVAREVGTEGKLGGQAQVGGVAGTWKDLTDSVNSMASNLTGQVRNIAEVTTAVARGDLSRKITVEVKGEILALKNTINTMVDQLNSFAGEVTRVAREVGTEGKLGGQAEVRGVAGTWKDLTDNVNLMASNLTDQVRGIVKVVTAVADGNLRQKLTVQAKGEVAALADTINGMTDTLAIFADQVTNVAREVGVDGRLGGQANVPGAAGTWKDLTGNVNLLAANLTTQVRAIAEVATAVTKGDLTRSIQVDANGEVAELKDNINTMISNLRETTESNREQDWLKTNLAKFTGMLQGQRELKTVGQMLLSELAPLVNAHQGTIYHLGGSELSLVSSYAHGGQKRAQRLAMGEGLAGQCAVEKKRILLTEVPPEFITVSSSLGQARKVSIIVLPVLFESQTKAVIELASLQTFSPGSLAFLDLLTQSIGAVFNTIEATMRTEGLLTQSQQLTVELQSRQSELQQTNEELGNKARLLAEQNAEVERKNAEVEQARHALEEKAAELALTSKYKSEFLANMSHELRTPLNSILILSQQLAENASGNLLPRQVEFSRNVNSSGYDLLNLINDILDLSKIESGTVTVEVEEIPFTELQLNVDRNFRHVAEAKNLPFQTQFSPELPRVMASDPKRLQQVLKNLLSNAVKFTASGKVELKVGLATKGWSPDHPVLGKAASVVSFAVEDTGIGIAPDKQRLVFEAFQQADAGTSRKYGGTGLGLAISRELAVLLGGEIKLVSTWGKGSTFTLYLPLRYAGPDGAQAGLAKPGSTAAQRMTVLPVAREEHIEDDRNTIVAGDPVLLIIEDDPHYARILLGLARDKGVKGLVATKGAMGLSLARQFRPTAISLDIFLPDMLGWTVLNQLKLDSATRHIPVQIVTLEEERQHGLEHGAFSYLIKEPSTEGLEASIDRMKDFTVPRTKRLLIVEDNELERSSVVELLGHDDIEIVTAGTGEEALASMREKPFDCVVLDLRLPDMTGFTLLEQMHAEPKLMEVPVVVFTGKDLKPDEQSRLKAMAKSIVLKDVQSPERLLDETALFLHRVVTELPPHKQAMIERLHSSREVLRNRKVLVVDDDVRNIFALTSLLENHDVQVISTTNGKGAIELIRGTPDLSLVLMDIMMPEMDGYETMREIRKVPEFRTLPILALTAKAMKGDREKCLDAGASDYISKPVNTDQLLSLMRVWLFR
ncbi:MAG: HAMP domain-containing protein [Archangium sp.]|nr:HAMP domain-containing protein [Archangium sp.]